MANKILLVAIVVAIFECVRSELTADGLPFTFDQKDYKPHKVMIQGVELTDTFGFVDPSYLPLDHHGYSEVVDKCDFTKDVTPLYKYGSMSTVNYYPNTPDFSRFRGIDMIPENKANYVRGSDFASNLIFDKKNEITEEDLTISQCRAPADDGATWHVQRVGPFYSTGGYDWWQIGWSDAGMFSEILEKHPEGFDVLNTILVPVLEDGTRLGHPPIHIHHIHFVEQQGVRFRNVMRGICVSSSGTTIMQLDSLVKENNCYNSSLFLEQHGDYQCTPEDDGVECLTAGDKNLRRIAQVLDIEGELNDVRPFNSPKMKWYYQIALKWKPINPDIRPVSQMTIMAPGNAMIGDQLGRVVTFPTPTDAPRFMWYTGFFWADGELIRNKLHAHNLVFESSSFFLATREDLGIDNPRWLPKKAYSPEKVTDLGFTDNDDLATYIFNNLKKAQDNYDVKCTGGADPKNDVCTRPRPQWVCAAHYNSDSFSFGDPPKEFKFDRRPPCWCSPLKFKKGDQFIVTAFSRKLTQAPIPPYPDRIPPTIPGHVSWHFWYYHEGAGNSVFGRIVCNQHGIFFNAALNYGFTEITSRIASVLIHQGIPVGFYTIYTVRFVLIGIIAYLLVFTGYMLSKKKKE